MRTLRKPVSQVKGHPSLHRKAKRAERNGKVLAPAVLAGFLGEVNEAAAFVLAAAMLTTQAYNPFIYFIF